MSLTFSIRPARELKGNEPGTKAAGTGMRVTKSGRIAYGSSSFRPGSPRAWATSAAYGARSSYFSRN